MKKAILVILFILLIIIAGGLYYVFSNLDTIVKTAIEKYGSESTHTEVQVDSVKIILADGSASIKGLTIANPEGFSLPYAFSLGEITTDINIEKTTNEFIAIDLIDIKSPEIFYEINSEHKGSLNELKDSLEKGTVDSKTKSKPASKPESAEKSSLKMHITRFLLQDARLQAKLVPANNKTYDLKLPPLQLNNLDGTPEQISKQVLNQLIEHAKKEIKKQGLDRELDALRSKAQKQIDAEKEKLQEQAESKAKEHLNNLFKSN